MTNETNKSRPTHRVYAVAKNGEKKFWQPIGALWAHADGKGFNQRLDKAPEPSLDKALRKSLSLDCWSWLSMSRN